MVEEPIQAAIWNCLNHYDYTDAIFLAERLRAEVETDESLYLLATCYYRAGKRAQAYSVLSTRKLISPKSRFLFAKCCIELGRVMEAELTLTGGNKEKYVTEEDVIKEFKEESPFVLQLLGRIYYRSERPDDGARAFKWSLRLNPLLWVSFQELCFYGEHVDPNELFDSSALNRYKISNTDIKSCADLNNDSTLDNTKNDALSCKTENGSIYHNSSTPAQPLNAINNNSMSGIRQFTPEDGQYPFINTLPAVGKAGNKTCGYSPFAASFGILPLDVNTPNESFCVSPSNNKIPVGARPLSGPLTNTNDQKILNRRKLLRCKDTVTPLQMTKPVVLSQLDNTEKSASIPMKSPMSVRRSSRIISNYSVKENNKSSHRNFISPKSPSHKLKPTKKLRTIKSTLNEVNENPVKPVKPIVDEEKPVKPKSAEIELETLHKESLEGLLSLFRDIGKGYYYLSQYDCTKAIECLSALPQNHRETGQILTWIGKAYVELHEYKESLRYFKIVEEIEPYRVSGLEMYSTALWHLHKDVELSYLAHNMMKFDRLSPSTWCIAGNCLSLQKEHEVAIKFFQRAIQLNPNFVYAYTLLGHEYVVTEDLEKALSCFRTAVRVQPRHYNAWYGMGSIYSKQEKYFLAEFHFKKALEIHPSSAVIMCHIGVVQSALQKPYSALETFNSALTINPKSALCKFHRASLYFNMGNYDNALKELQELMELVPKESLVYYLSGKVHKKLGNHHMALMCFSWATDLDPKGTNAQVKESNSDLMNASFNDLIGTGPLNDSVERNVDVQTPALLVVPRGL